ncbi:UDP-N-acetylmuramoyl-L-alanine--D-glutamate ligase [Candidatus Dependentiae bacterium]|nr:UDP-N-acetylmuramoyl-L-alanine--D-glutamate ligase [Candidatus Dependentiae bacterium]
MKSKNKALFNRTNKKIGVWGLGVVGKAAVSFLHTQNIYITVCNDKNLTASEKNFLQKYNAFFCHQKNINYFFQENDFIVVSPGIDLTPYKKYQHKFLAELDLFQEFCTKPLIAITGSVGKTTIVTLLEEILKKYGHTVLVGGNIGISTLSLLSKQNNADYIILEVSSFQLEYCKQFAPDFAIITNLYPNHLDRHKTVEQYCTTKLNIIKYQNMHQKALLPLSIHEILPKNNKSNISFFSDQKPKQFLDRCSYFFTLNNLVIMRHYGSKNNIEESIIYLSFFPNITFTQNWLIITAILYLLGKKVKSENIQSQFTLPKHRLEKVTTIDGITFYNDSKATTPSSTLAAVNQLQGKPIHLFLGGLSKGIDRTDLITQLKNKVCFIYCFGKEAKELKKMCTQNNIPAQHYSNLDDAFQASLQKAHPGVQIVLSPSGSSFDLFKNYEERGNYFKKLILMLSGSNAKKA